MSESIWTRPGQDLTTLAALGLLCERPRHVYDIQRELRDRHKDFAQGSARAIYRAVERLVRGGLVELLETFRDGHRPERSVYHATDQGREEYRNWLIDLLSDPVGGPRSFSAALSLIGSLSQRESVVALARRVVHLQGRIAAIEAARSSLIEQFGMPRLFILERDYEACLWRAELDWVLRLVAELRSGELAGDPAWLEGHAQLQVPEPGEAPLALRRPKGADRKLRLEQGGKS
ncbi:MAG: PadR family transcriptional regulator [Candidatus Dormibacteria bacterium]